MEPQKTPNCQSNLEKNNKAGDITFSDFRQYYTATVIQKAWFWHQKQTHRSMG